MNDNDRKRLTELLKECWHQKSSSMPKNKCHLCGGDIRKLRTFTTPDDVFAVKDAIVKMGKWNEFGSYVWDTWTDQCEDGEYPIFVFVHWLFRTVNKKGEPHFCQLVTDWWKEATNGR